MDAEAAMAKALSGKFFWEPSIGVSERGAETGKEIARAQRQFRDKPEKEPPPHTPSLDERVAMVRKAVMAQSLLGGIKSDGFSLLKTAICACYGITTERLMRRTSSPVIGAIKQHFYWCLPRYFQNMSVAEMARQVEKHHTVVFSMKKKFEKQKANYLAEIEIIDRAMEGVCG